MVVIARNLRTSKKSIEGSLVDKPVMVPIGPEGEYTFVDLFCGAGGVTEGVIDVPNVQVVGAINHSPTAIKCYQERNPSVQCFIEDIRQFDEKKLPKKINFLWASTECTHHSNAAGGRSRDADSRSLPEHLEKYVLWSNPDYFIVENVKEFLTWRPVKIKRDENGKIVKYHIGNAVPPVVPQSIIAAIIKNTERQLEQAAA